MWKSIYDFNNIQIKNGDKIICTGNYGIYQRVGKNQLTIRDFKIEGLGKLQKKFLEYKEEYKLNGYFDEKKKKKLIKEIENIGIVTSIDSSAYQDILSVFTRKNPYINLFVCDSRVQGINCQIGLSESIKLLDEKNLDVILISRGGGSLEDLWGFNEPNLIETIYHCKTPIISAVGHETDYTLCDYVSDIRAITPSIGADIIVLDINTIIHQIKDTYFLIEQLIDNVYNNFYSDMETKINKLKELDPIKDISKIQQKISNLFDKITLETEHKIYNIESNINDKKEKIEMINPNNLIKNGYIMVKDHNDNIVSKKIHLKDCEFIKLVFMDGEKIIYI